MPPGRFDAGGENDGFAIHRHRTDADAVDRLDRVERSVDHAIGVLRGPGRTIASRSALETVAAERAAFWEPLAADQGRKAGTDIPTSTTEVGVSEDDLVAAIDALIGNVFSHTDEGVGYTIGVDIAADVAAVRIDDAGNGFASGDLLERGASATGSTGLGLDIARRTAELAGGRLDIDRSPLGGASVRLVFPIG